MKTRVQFGEVGLNTLVGGKIEKAECFGVPSVAAVHEPDLAADVESSGTGVNRSLSNDRELVQNRLIGPVSAEVTEVVIVFRRIGVPGDTGFYPPIKFVWAGRGTRRWGRRRASLG